MPKIKRLALSLALTAGIITPLAVQVTPAQARHSQVALFEDDYALLSNPSGTVSTLQAMGVGMIRVTVDWATVAPSPKSTRKPHFNDRNSSSYPSGVWDRYDRVIAAARAANIQVDLLLTGGEPYWASSSRIPSEAKSLLFAWKPQPKLYGNFVSAVANRYRGQVSLYELFNEPNFGEDLAPQGEHRRLEAAAAYRSLVDAGYSSLRSAHVGSSSVVIGNLAARGTNTNGEFNQTRALTFVRALYCVDSGLRALRGSAASSVGCPTRPSRSFARQHPGLFSTSFGIHPYPQGLPPTQDSVNDPDYGTFNHLGSLERTLDGAQRAYGSHHRSDVWNNEFGYVTHPPNLNRAFASPTQAAVYMNQAEYLSWRDGRVASAMQFLLRDPSEAQARNPHASHFYSGLESSRGKPKATFAAYRMPLWMPSSSTHRGGRLEVWADVRPAHVYSGTQYAYVQFQRGSRGKYSTAAKVKLTDPRGYFDIGVRFPASGHVRVLWSYPDGTAAYSRTASVSVR